MAAYVTVSYDVVDPQAFETYIPRVQPLLKKHGAEVLVADQEAETLEGEPRSVIVVLRFASREAALAWYNDPDYAPVRQVRLDSCANNRLTIAHEFTPPGE